MPAIFRLSKGARRHIRNEKADIRRRFGNSPETEEKIKELIRSFTDQKSKEKKEEKVELPEAPKEVKATKAAKKRKTK